MATVTSYTKSQLDALLGAKAPLAAPAFTGVPTAPTASTGSASTQLATTSFVANAISGLSGGGGGGGSTSGGVVVNAKDYGITTGSSDIGPAVNNLITTMTANGGGVIGFPAGNYSVGTTIALKSGVYLVGFAPNHGYIALSPSVQVVKFSQNSNMGGYIIKSNNGLSMGVQGIDVSGNGGPGTGGIWLDQCYWGAIKQSMANGFGESGYKVTGGFANALEDLMTTNCVNSGVSNYTGACDIDGTDHYVSRCEFACRALSSGIANANKYVVAMAVRGSNHFIDTIVGETSDKGFYITATKSRFVNLRADTNNGDGFHVFGGTNDFTNCDAIGNSQAGNNQHDGWIIENGAWRCRFIGCTVSLAGSIYCRYGFNEQTNIANPVYAPTFVGSSVEDAATARWYHPNGSYAGVSFAGTMKPDRSGTPSAYESSLMDTSNFTSSTTITNFVGGAEGQRLSIIGNSNITIQNGGSIFTGTGGNVTMSNNKLYVFTFFHGTWYGA